MIRIFTIVYIFFIATNLTAQEDKYLDPNYLKWIDEELTLEERTSAYNNFIERHFLYSSPDSVIFHTKKLIDFSKRENFDRGISRALILNGNTHLVRSQFEEAIVDYNKAVLIYQKIDDLHGLGICYANIGNVYNYESDYPNALFNYLKAIKLFEEEEFDEGIAGLSMNIGTIYHRLLDWENALKYYKVAEARFKKLNKPRGTATSYTNIATIYREQNIDSISEVYYNKAIKILSDLSQNQGLASAKLSLGTLFENNNNYDDAMSNFNDALVLYNEIGDVYGIATTLSYIGLINNDISKSDKAIENCEKALDFLKEDNALKEKLDIYWCLYEGYKLKNNSTKSLYYHELYLSTSDSIKKEETSKKLQRMEFDKKVLADSLQQVEKDLKLKMAHQEEVRKKDMNKNIALAGGVFFLFLSGGLYGRWRYVKNSKAIIEKEKDRSESLLLNILPSEIAEELKAKGSADARDFDMVSILFTDFKGFTQVSEKLTAQELIKEINTCFKAFDHICEYYNIEKIKTIGDAYMAAGGLPVPYETAAKNTVLAALEMQEFITNRYNEKTSKGERAFKMRVGIHSGPVVAGIVGVKKFQYDIWGDTVNTASRMESSGEIEKVNISETTYKLLKDDTEFEFASRGKVKAKGKGEIEMFFVSKP